MPRLRSLMLWLVVLAVPLQGLAAATMLNCAAVHGPSSVALDHAGHGDHDHGSVAVAAHGEAAADAGTAHAADHKCSACAACHASAALPVAVPALPAVDTAQAHPVARASAAAPFLTGGLERPPRSRHA
jgi:hypothetical protein